MKKIMFNDRYGLTQAVIEGRKTMTRRIMNNQYGNLAGCVGFTKKDRACTYVRADFDNGISEDAIYAIDEIVAVAQRYEDLANIYHDKGSYLLQLSKVHGYKLTYITELPGWRNKMFVDPQLMPHRIRISGIKCERLQDISDEDCFKEGINASNSHEIGYGIPWVYEFAGSKMVYYTPLEAFAALIDKVSGRGTWASNPWVVAYEFELVK